MIKPYTFVSCSVVFAVALFGCGGKKKEEPAGDKPAPAADKGGAPAAPAGGGGDCIVGNYEWNDNGALRGFVFNADKSGKEIYEAGKDERPLTWSIKSDKVVHLSYTKSGDNMGGEFDIPYDCAAGSVGSIATPYKRK